jgi:hypothetical protein
MGTSLPHKWTKVDEPEAGTYTLVMLAGYNPVGKDMSSHVACYVCTSDDGYLNEAFAFNDPAWRPTQ